MSDHGTQANGFRGPADGFPTLAQATAGGAVLRLPTVGRPLHAIDDGPFAAIEVRSLTESMGTVEAAMQRFAELLEPDGRLVVDVENEQSTRRLRQVLEGRPGSFDPVGSLLDPCRPVSLRRLLQAADTAGLCVEDVLRVPTPPGEVPGDVAAAMLAEGFLPFDWIGSPPPQRFWLCLQKRRPLGGSVLIGPGDAAAQERTAASVRALVPADWEVLLAPPRPEATEAGAFTALIGRARGELVWFLRAGAVCDAGAWRELLLLGGIVGAAPGRADGERTCPGDVSGMLLPRQLALLAGPLPAAANTQVALEEWCMRLETLAPDLAVAVGGFETPPPPREAPAAFQREAEAMLRRWQPILGAPVAPPMPDPTAATGATSTTAPEAAPWVGREPRVSLVMMARDEQRFLGECLRRAAPAVDEIVVVDTGSTDDTVAIAELFGARVVRQPWAEDFSAPRNRGLELATGDWVLVLDADEFLVDGAAARIRELVRATDVCGYHMRFTNIYTGGKTVGVMMVRLFRNLPGVAWRNLIHEQVTPSLVAAGAERGLRLAACEVEVEHHGYANDVMESRGKNERNERLFRRQLELEPDDIYCHYKYGDFLRRVPGRDADAWRLLARALELIAAGSPSLPRELPYAGEVAALCALEHTRRGDTDGAVAIVDHALRRFVPTPNLHYVAANLMLAIGASDAAIAHFRRCLSYRGQVLVVPIQDGITGHVSLLGIAQALAQRGDLRRSQQLAERAVELAPDHEVGHMVLSKLQLLRGDLVAALKTMTNYLVGHPESPGACQQTTLILQRMGCRAEARRMGERAIDLLRRDGQGREVARMQEILAAL